MHTVYTTISPEIQQNNFSFQILQKLESESNESYQIISLDYNSNLIKVPCETEVELYSANQV